jgi:hypothetical protein
MKGGLHRRPAGITATMGEAAILHAPRHGNAKPAREDPNRVHGAHQRLVPKVSKPCREGRCRRCTAVTCTCNCGHPYK